MKTKRYLLYIGFLSAGTVGAVSVIINNDTADPVVAFKDGVVIGTEIGPEQQTAIIYDNAPLGFVLVHLCNGKAKERLHVHQKTDNAPADEQTVAMDVSDILLRELEGDAGNLFTVEEIKSVK